MTRRTTKKTTGGSRPFAALLGAVLAAGTALGAPGGAGERAVIAGTVFREPGFALPRAEVTLAVRTPPQGSEAKKKPKPQRALTDGRGEFAFYVPAAKSVYVLTVKAEGLETQEKTVELSGGLERTDTYFTLKAASTAPGKD